MKTDVQNVHETVVGFDTKLKTSLISLLVITVVTQKGYTSNDNKAQNDTFKLSASESPTFKKFHNLTFFHCVVG